MDQGKLHDMLSPGLVPPNMPNAGYKEGPIPSGTGHDKPYTRQFLFFSGIFNTSLKLETLDIFRTCPNPDQYKITNLDGKRNIF